MAFNMISSNQFQPRQKKILLAARSDFDLFTNHNTGKPVELTHTEKKRISFSYGQCFKSITTTSEKYNQTKPIVGVRNGGFWG